jgi:hypothetical protein
MNQGTTPGRARFWAVVGRARPLGALASLSSLSPGQGDAVGLGALAPDRLGDRRAGFFAQAVEPGAQAPTCAGRAYQALGQEC